VRLFIPSGKPQALEIQVEVHPNNGTSNSIKVFTFAANPTSYDDAQFITEIPKGTTTVKPFPVTVRWQGDQPQTRLTHRDNFDAIFLNPISGQFILVEMSIVTRNGYFWLMAQELYCGQWIRTTQKRVVTELKLQSIPHGRYPMTVVPLYDANAYPGADFLEQFPEVGQQVAPFVIQLGAFVPYHKCVKAVWTPKPAELPEAMRGKGVILGVTKFFNGVVGYGQLICEDGEPCFVHFSNVVDDRGTPVGSRGQLPMLEPMKYVALRRKQGQKGWQATSVRLLE
jgi:cold shock CspA family protein